MSDARIKISTANGDRFVDIPEGQTRRMPRGATVELVSGGPIVKSGGTVHVPKEQ